MHSTSYELQFKEYLGESSSQGKTSFFIIVWLMGSVKKNNEIKNPILSLKLWLTQKDLLLTNKPISSLQLGAVFTEKAAKTPTDLKRWVCCPS